jgi:hypothetical protein
LDRANHYETAFEAYLQAQRLCYIAVDESRRTLLQEGPVKSIDFIVHGPWGARLLIDVKGKRFPGGTTEKPRHVWESWSLREDISGLECWAEHFGPEYQGALVFAYALGSDVWVPEDSDDLWTHGGRRYLFRAVTVADYHRHMRVRSPRWNTVYLPRAIFRRLVRPLRHLTHAAAPVADECPI